MPLAFIGQDPVVTDKTDLYNGPHVQQELVEYLFICTNVQGAADDLHLVL